MTEHEDNFLHYEELEEFLLSGPIVSMPNQPPLIFTPTKAGERFAPRRKRPRFWNSPLQKWVCNGGVPGSGRTRTHGLVCT
jgi:hypothetical protein